MMISSLRTKATTGAIILLLIGAPAAVLPAAAAEEKPTALNQFFIDLLGLDNAPPPKVHHKRRHKAVRHVKPVKAAETPPKPIPAPAPKIDAAALRDAVKESIAENPAVLRDVIADFVRNDQELRKQLAASVPKSEPAPPTTIVATPAPPQKAAAIGTGEIEKIVHKYLVTHPEVLPEAMAELEKRQTAAEAAKHQAAVKQHAAALYSSPNQVTLGNPQGNVTFVEFFDYNCGYCKRAMGDMLTLMKDDPKLKVVLKEYPVLGPGSLEAAQVAVAVNMQDKTGKKYLEFHQKLLGIRGQANKAAAMAVAKSIGMDMAKLEKDLAGDEVDKTLEENRNLGMALGMNGTPSYVIGDNVVVGAVGLDALRQTVNTVRCGKVTC